MSKTTVTYNAPQGDSKVCEMGGVTFFDGKEVELDAGENERLLGKLKTNPHFEVSEVGRPTKAQLEAKAKAAAPPPLAPKPPVTAAKLEA